ncbi:hypothetical protein TNCV_4163951 [Trichonephila clavipes]|nr:hypothetical protein TNCV_4163951 [Trichonephila clavipes]
MERSGYASFPPTSLVDDPSKQQERVRCFPFETGIRYRRKTDFFPEESTSMSYSGFEPEPTRLQAEGHSPHTGLATFPLWVENDDKLLCSNKYTKME